MRLVRLVLIAALLNICLPATGQLTSPAQLAIAFRAAESVFDNGGQPWPFTNLVPAIAYDIGGQGIAYNVVARTDPACTQNGSSYRSDYINFKTSPWTAQPSIPFIVCGSTTLPSGGDRHNYIISVTQAGPYTITLYTVNTNSGAIWDVLLDNNPTPLARMTLGSGANFSTVISTTSSPFNIGAGQHTISLVGVSGDPSANYIGDLAGWQGAVVGGAPAMAQTAGYTTNVVTADFTQVGGPYGSIGSWLNCGFTSGGGPSGLHWFAGGDFGANKCANFSIKTDGATQVLDLHFTGADTNNVWLTFGNYLQNGTSLSPAHYVKVIMRTVGPYLTTAGRNSPSYDFWQAFAGGFPASGAVMENDHFELAGETSEPISISGNSTWYQYTTCPAGNIGGLRCFSGQYPAGSLNVEQYHTFEWIGTTNGTSDFWGCTLIDGTLFAGICTDANSPSVMNANDVHIMTDKSVVDLFQGNPGGTSASGDVYIQRIEIWACPGYASAGCSGGTLIEKWPCSGSPVCS